MHVISRRRLREFWEVHADAEEALTRWYTLASKAGWANFAELKANCPSADQVDHLIVINIGGNKYRLIIEVFFQDEVVLVRHVLTHKQYDKGQWESQATVPGRMSSSWGRVQEPKVKPRTRRCPLL